MTHPCDIVSGTRRRLLLDAWGDDVVTVERVDTRQRVHVRFDSGARLLLPIAMTTHHDTTRP